MSDFTRGFTFETDEKLTPSKLNLLVDQGTVTGIDLDELGPELSSIFYTDTDPGATIARMWYDTTSGSEGQKFAYCTPSNASVCDWLYATPRREGYFFAPTSVSFGTPLFIGRRNDMDTGVGLQSAITIFDGAPMPRVFPASGNASFTGIQAGLVVALQSVSGAQPVKCAWAGIVPAETFTSGTSQANPLYVSYGENRSLLFRADAPVPGEGAFDDLEAYWRMDESATGATRVDSSTNVNHLQDTGTFVGGVSASVSNGALFEGLTTNRLRFNGTPPASLRYENEPLSIAMWVTIGEKTPQRLALAMNNNSPNGRDYHIDLRGTSITDRLNFRVYPPDGITEIDVEADTFGSPPVSTPIFIVAQHNPDTDKIRISINDGAFDETTHFSGIHSGTGGFAIGIHDNNVLPWEGVIDEVAMWRRIIPAALITSLYNAGAGRSLDDADVAGSALAQSAVYGIALQNATTVSAVSLNSPFWLWGNGPVIQDHA